MDIQVEKHIHDTTELEGLRKSALQHSSPPKKREGKKKIKIVVFSSPVLFV